MELEVSGPRVGLFPVPVISPIIPDVSQTLVLSHYLFMRRSRVRLRCLFAAIIHRSNLVSLRWQNVRPYNASVNASVATLNPKLSSVAMRPTKPVFQGFKLGFQLLKGMPSGIFQIGFAKQTTSRCPVRSANKGMNRNKLQASVEAGGFWSTCRLVSHACN